MRISNSPILPGHLMDKHLYMYTVGCKGEYTMGTILDSWGGAQTKDPARRLQVLGGGQEQCAGPLWGKHQGDQEHHEA